MNVIRRTDRYRVDLRVVQDLVVIFDGLAAFVFGDGGVGPILHDIAEIFDLGIFVGHVGGDMGTVRNRAATNHGNCNFVHRFSSKIVD